MPVGKLQFQLKALSCGRNATSSTLRYRAVAPFVPLPLESNANSDSGTVNCEKPQAKQTKSFGNTKTPGSSTFLRLRKWMTISAANSDSLLDPHNRQDIAPPTHPGDSGELETALWWESLPASLNTLVRLDTLKQYAFRRFYRGMPRIGQEHVPRQCGRQRYATTDFLLPD